MNVKRKWNVLVLTAILLLTAGLTGCSGGSGEGKQTAEANEIKGAAAQPVELNVWGRWEEANGQINETIAEFEKQYPNIKVKYTNVPQQYVPQVQTAIAGNSLPDIFGYHPSLPTSLLNNLGVLHDLNDVLSDEERAQYYEGTWSEGHTTLNGSTYAFPLFNPMRPSMMMYYNKTALKEAGLTESDIPKTWDELYTFCQKVKENTGSRIYGLVIGVKATSFLNAVVSQMATAITPEVTPTTLFNYKTGQYEYNSPGIIQGLKLFKKLQDDKLLHPNSLVMSYREGTAMMEEGQAVLTMDGSFLASQLNKDRLDNYGVAPLPTLDGKPQYMGFQGESRVAFMVSKSTKHYEESKLFLRFLKDHLYAKLVRDGIEYSPIPSINQDTEIANPVAKQALKLQDETFILIPRPFERNPNSIKVGLEASGKLPKTTLADIAEGYLSGQIQDIDQELTKLTDESNKVFGEAIDKVNRDGGSIKKEDYIFKDWVPFKSY